MKKVGADVENLSRYNVSCKLCKTDLNIVKDSFFCIKCNFLNPLNNMDYFSYMHQVPSLNLNLEDLENKYLFLMSVCHPDRFVVSSEECKLNAIQHSSYLNEAYNTLKDFLNRFAYLYLLLYNKNIVEEKEIIHHSLVSSEFMQYYEDLEKLKTSEEKQSFKTKILELEQNEQDKALGLNFNEDHKSIHNCYVRLKYIKRLLTLIA